MGPKTQYVSLAIFLFVIVLIAATATYFRNIARQHPFENKKSQMKTLPSDIKEKLRSASPSAAFRVPVLLYHYVEYVKDAKDTIRKSLDIAPNIFEEQVKTLINAGYTFMTAGDLGEFLDGKKTLPQKPVVFTFDDGYRDFYTDVLPILKKYNVKTTAYIVPGFIDKPNSMFRSQIEEVVKSGLVEIGAHTVHHVFLKGVSRKEVEKEVKESKTMLENEFHVPVFSFAYPYGSFDTQAIEVVKDAGFKTAASTIPGADLSEQNRFFIYRIHPGNRVGNELLNYLEKTTFKH